MNQLVLVWSPANRAKFKETPGAGGAIHPVLTEAWLEPRFKMWKDYVLQSILNQTYQDFIYCFCCDPASKGIVDRLWKQIKDPRVILDYHKSRESQEFIREISAKYDEIVTLRIDTDDLYHPQALEDVAKTRNEWTFFQYGYGYDWGSGRLWHYNTKGTGPFFSHRYKGSHFARKDEINEPPHNEVRKHKPLRLMEPRFMVSVHGRNTTTTTDSKTFCEEIGYDVKDRILEQFGICV